jgi:uroporphyrin-III C-methyltransferase/precorrin-2 dehydrogenase/sirohydrochlorin ferrochelatase
MLYPVALDLRGRTCVVVGGEGPAETKVEALLKAGARVSVVAPSLGPKLAALVARGCLRQVARPYRPGDLEGAFLAVSTLADAAINQAFWEEAQARGIPANVVDDPARSSFIAPAVVRRGDLAVAISTGGRAPALAVRLKQWLAGRLGEEYARFLELVGPLRPRVAARWPGFEERRRAWYRLVDSEVLELLRRGEEARARRRILEILGLPDTAAQAVGVSPKPEIGRLPSRRLEASKQGTVFLIGAGPGDPKLITVRGLECLRRADVVLYDRLVDPRLADYAPLGAERIDLARPAGERLSQEEISTLLVSRARAGRVVVRLKGGDPFVFGRGGEEAAACAAAGVPCEVVPGVTSAVGVPTAAGIPLTYRGLASSFTVATAHRAGDIDQVDDHALAAADTLVLLMGGGRLARLTAKLIVAGRRPETPAAVIEWGTWPQERVLVSTLGDLAERARAAGIEPPATVVVGQVVRLRALLVAGTALSPSRSSPVGITALARSARPRVRFPAARETASAKSVGR